MQIKSKEIDIQATPEQVFRQIADCNHLKQGIGLANVPQMSDLECSDTECSFQMTGVGRTALRIRETTFPSEVVYDVKNENIKSVTVVFHIEGNGAQTRLSSTADMDLPFFMSQMLKPVLQNFINILVESVKTTTERQNA
ncbi:MAG: hypothetical protein J5792_05375 [Bacteroidales bacterium]|nr:hypothetical protein [Bacteroidales bacterium]